MKKKNDISEKTNVMRLLDAANIEYISHSYDPEKAVSATEVASILNQDVESVFKTLVTVSKSREHYVFVIPGNAELDLKKAAKAAGEKNIEMLPSKELLPLTGYIHGGCSPIGMKKQFRTFIDETAMLFDTICVSGGKRGEQIQLDPNQLKDYVGAEFVPLTKD